MDAIKLKDWMIDNYKKLFIIVMLPYLFFYFNYSLYDIDTGWFAEPAYTYLNDGPMAMPSWKGVMGWEQYTYWYPPMIFWLQIITYKLLGFGLRQDNFMLLTILFTTIFATLKLSREMYDEKISKITALLLLSNALYFTFGLYGNRSDVLVGLWNVLALMSYLKSRQDKKYLYAVGLFGGLSVSSHLVGILIAPLIGLVIFLYEKNEFKELISKWIKIFIGFLAGILPWMLYASKDFPLFIKQLYGNTKGDLLVSLATETHRLSGFFLHKSILLLSPILIYALYYTWKNRDNKNKTLFTIIFATVIILPFVSHKSPRYYASILPFWTILAAKMFHDFFSSRNKKTVQRASILFIFVVITSLFANAALFLIMHNNNNYLAMEEHLNTNYDWSDKKVIAQPAFYFIFKDKQVALNTFWHRSGRTNETFEEIYSSFNPTHIVVDSYFRYYVSRNNTLIYAKLNEVVENAKKIDEFCFIGNRDAINESLLLLRANHNYFGLLKNSVLGKKVCIDYVELYELS